MANLALSTEKCHMMMTKSVVLGHLLSVVDIQVDLTIVQLNLILFPPKTQNDVYIFLGATAYYRHFIENYSKIVSPFYELLMKDATFLWTNDYRVAFRKLSNLVSTTLVLCRPNWKFPFHIASDTFDMVVIAKLKKRNIRNHMPSIIPTKTCHQQN